MAKTSTNTKRGRPPKPVNQNVKHIFDFQSIKNYREAFFYIENGDKENSATRIMFYGDKGFDINMYNEEKDLPYSLLKMWNETGDKTVIINDRGVITI